MKNISSIKSLPASERPRERIKKYGVDHLSNEELLMILIGSGNKYESAREISIKILSEVKEIGELSNFNYERLSKIKGLGPSKISIILASFELSKRIKNNNLIDIKFTNAEKIYNYFKDIFLYEKQECFYAIYLDAAKKIIKVKLLFKGTLDHSLVHPREVFKEAYLLSASAIICIHNHPSGNVSPSKEDKVLTNNLVQIGLIHGIPIVDHLIIGNSTYYSFYENGEM